MDKKLAWRSDTSTQGIYTKVSGLRSIVRRFDDVVFKTGASFSQQAIGHHFARPFDWKVRGKDPYVGRGPYGPMILR